MAGVLRALRGADLALTAIVTVADDGGSSGELRRRRTGPAVGDARRLLLELTATNEPLAQAFTRRLTINRLGEHPLGNLLLWTLTNAFGDFQQAIDWLGNRLGVDGRVLPASSEPVTLLAESSGERLIRGESAIRTAGVPIHRLRFDPAQPSVPPAAIAAVEQASWVLLAPGSLFTSVLAVCALPKIATALARTSARVAWICNLVPEESETTAMTAIDHLAALRRHGLRVDAALYDPAAEVSFAADQVPPGHIELIPRPLRSSDPGSHDPALLRAALVQLFNEKSTQTSAATAAGR
jgi:uncharacterized cofD-like protein